MQGFRHIRVKVKAGMRKERVKKIGQDRLEIAVREKPEQNRANERVTELLALHFAVALSSVRLIGGHHRPSKVFLIPV